MARKLRSARPRAAAAELRDRDRTRASRVKPARITRTNRLRREPLREAPPEARTEARISEPLSSIYLTAGSDVALDGGHIARGLRRLSPTARIRAARGRLPDHSNRHVLSRGQ